MITLYQIDNKKQLREWVICSDANNIIIEHGLQGGRMTKQVESISVGLGGRSLSEQLYSRMNSRVNKQLAKGYRYTIDDAEKYVGQNEMNFFKPMLAQQFDKQSRVNTDGAVIQRKLDGNRMLVTKSNGKIVCYTRNGKPITTLGHITTQLGWLEEGQTIDGEVYVHGMPLKDINSRIRKKQDGTLDLNYHIYDTVEDMPFTERYSTILGEGSSENIVVEPYWTYMDKGAIKALFDEVRKDGYEGLMMRLDNTGYQTGKRSKGLLKIKYRYDAEFLVVDIEKAKDGTAILVMKLPNGKTVKGVAPGSRLEKINVAENPWIYIGNECTCSYAYMTEYGIPFHLTCDRWRM